MRFSFEWRKYAIVIWAINALALLAAHWRPEPQLLIFPLFVAIAVGFIALCRFNREYGLRLDEMLKDARSRIQLLGVLSLIYVGINSWLCIFALRDGQPHLHEGLYYLSQDGHLVRQITQAEYDRLTLMMGRLFLGGLLAFSSLTMMGFDKRKSDGFYPY